jgi:hypothetical protein
MGCSDGWESAVGGAESAADDLAKGVVDERRSVTVPLVLLFRPLEISFRQLRYMWGTRRE